MQLSKTTGLLVAFYLGSILGCSQFSAKDFSPAFAPQPLTDSVYVTLEKLRMDHTQGIPVEVAQAAMQANGYECQIKTQERFKYQPQGEHRTPMPETGEIDYLECFRKSQSGWVTSFFTAALVIEDGVIMEAFTRMEAVGP